MKQTIILAGMLALSPSAGFSDVRSGFGINCGLSIPAYSLYHKAEDFSRSATLPDSLPMSGSFALHARQTGPAFGGEFFLNFRKVDLGIAADIFSVTRSSASGLTSSGAEGRILVGRVSLRTQLLSPDASAMPYIALGLGVYTFRPSGSVAFSGKTALGIRVGFGVEAPLRESVFSVFGEMGMHFAEIIKVDQRKSSKENSIGIFTVGAGIRFRP